MSIKMFPPKDTVYNILNNQNNCEQQLLDFYNAYIMAVSCVSVYTDAGDYKKYYIEELENEIKNRIIIKLPVLRIAVRDKLDNDTLFKKSSEDVWILLFVLGYFKAIFLNKKDFFIIISLFRSDNLYYVNEGAKKASYEPWKICLLAL